MTIAELLIQRKEFSSLVRNMKLPSTTKILMREGLNDYIFYLDRIINNDKKFVNNKYFFRGAIYKLKASALDLLGRVFLPGKNLISDPYKKKIQADLMPGDICIVNRDKALSNVAFSGWWSHGLMHIGGPAKIDKFFSSDEEVTIYYSKRCSDEKLDCNSFSGYLDKKFPSKRAEQKNPKDSNWPNSIIEAVADGVVIRPISKSFNFNRATCFRPKLSKREKALAIEEAFSNVGKPYDFNFDARTYGRLACTELILWSYMPDPEKGKTGLHWINSVIMKIPALYGFDVVKSYFKYRDLDFLFYYESGRKLDQLREMSEEDLKKTIDLTGI